MWDVKRVLGLRYTRDKVWPPFLKVFQPPSQLDKPAFPFILFYFILFYAKTKQIVDDKAFDSILFTRAWGISTLTEYP
jgi:hypothetical protein